MSLLSPVQVFINWLDNSEELDAQGYAVFGKVTEGMENVKEFYHDYNEHGSGPSQVCPPSPSIAVKPVKPAKAVKPGFILCESHRAHIHHPCHAHHDVCAAWLAVSASDQARWQQVLEAGVPAVDVRWSFDLRVKPFWCMCALILRHSHVFLLPARSCT